MHQHPQVQNFLINKMMEEMYKILHNSKFHNSDFTDYHISLLGYLNSKVALEKIGPHLKKTTSAKAQKLWASSSSTDKKRSLNKLFGSRRQNICRLKLTR